MQYPVADALTTLPVEPDPEPFDLYQVKYLYDVVSRFGLQPALGYVPVLIEVARALEALPHPWFDPDLGVRPGTDEVAHRTALRAGLTCALSRRAQRVTALA